MLMMLAVGGTTPSQLATTHRAADADDARPRRVAAHAARCNAPERLMLMMLHDARPGRGGCTSAAFSISRAADADDARTGRHCASAACSNGQSG